MKPNEKFIQRQISTKVISVEASIKLDLLKTIQKHDVKDNIFKNAFLLHSPKDCGCFDIKYVVCH